MNNGTILLAMRLCVLLLAAGFSSPLAAEPPKNRKFNFEYGARIRAMSADVVRVWLPVPQTNAQQDVEIVKLDLPGKHRISYDPKYGNKILYFEWLPEGQESLELGVTYRVTRREFWALQSKKQAVLADAERKKFLASNKMVPLGPLDIPVLPMPIKTATRLGLARAIYDHVDSLVKYDKSKPGYGRGDVTWVCDSRTGNCTDFHSLFISLARTAKIPARFEIGFPLPEQRGQGEIGGYHCWAAFFAEQHGWVPVDISEADKHPELKEYYFGNLTENRIGFSLGRDIELVPKPSSPPLNYFVYPHVESGTQILAKEAIELRFRYRDLD